MYYYYNDILYYYDNRYDDLYYYLPQMMPITTFVPEYGFISAMSYPKVRGESEDCIYCKNAPSEDYRDGLNDLPGASLFRYVYKYASENGFVGGFPTFNKDGEVVLINTSFGVQDDILDLDPNPVNFTVHMRNVDRNLRGDDRYLSGFPNFHQSGRRFGAIRLFKNAGERRWVSAAELGFVETDLNEDRMKKAQNYAAGQQGFIGGFPTFEHRAQEFQIILLNKNAATVRYIPNPNPKKFPLKGEKETNLGRGHRVRTEVTVSKNGGVDVLSIFTSNNEVLGFHGYVDIQLVDTEGNIIDSFGQRGDADAKFTGNNKKEFRLSRNLSPEQLSQVEKIAIRHSRNPIPQITKEEAKMIAEKLAESQAEGE